MSYVPINFNLVDRQLTENETVLIGLIFDAHSNAAQNNYNASKQACSIAMQGSGSFVQSVASAILTLGSVVGRHGVTLGARRLLRGEVSVQDIIERGDMVPGFGNSFHKDGIDPAFVLVNEYISLNWSNYSDRVNAIRESISKYGKNLFPNPAMFTAITSEILGVRDGFESVLLIIPRIQSWAREVENV
jgi:citrate synthase